MGASGWNYTTPYDPDPEVALERLREEIFAAGDYLPPGGIMRFRNDNADAIADRGGERCAGRAV